MTIENVALIVLLGVAISAASYFIATSRVLAKVVKKQERQHRRDVRQSSQLLDRLLMRHGITELSPNAQVKTPSAVIAMPIADPFESAEAEWEREEQDRIRAMTALDDDERNEIAVEARSRVQ